MNIYRKALFLGGAQAQIPILLEAKKRGWYIITCDYLPNNPGHVYADEYFNVNTTDKDAVLKLSEEIRPDCIIAYASDPAAATAAYVSEKLDLVGNPVFSVEILSEKDLFRNFLSDNGFNVPKSAVLNTGDDPFEVTRDLEFPFILKPTDSSGSKGVVKVSEREELPAAILYATKYSRNGRIIAEEFIQAEGPQIHGDGFFDDGKLVFAYLGDHHYESSINPFVPYSTSWPSSHSKTTISFVLKEVERALSLVGFKFGPVNIEARIDVFGKVFIMEIGPRSGGNFVPQVIKQGTNVDMVSMLLDVYEGKNYSIPLYFKNDPCAYYVLHSAKDGKFCDVEIDDYLKARIFSQYLYVQQGDDVFAFNGANTAIGILLLIFANIEELKEFRRNPALHINVNLHYV